MLGHRKLNAEDYIAILKRRRWLIVLPVLIFPIISVGISLLLPAQYLSQTLVIIEEQKVPDQIAKSVVTTSLDQRLASMREQISSRSRIQPIIERYNLFPKSPNMDERVDLTRKAVTVKPIKSDISRIANLPGFFITFTYSDARTAQLVCSDITTLFVDANLKIRQDSAQGTTEFLRTQLEDAKRNLADQDAKLAAFQRQYGGKLPGQENSNLGMLTSLNTRLESTNEALARAQQDKSYQESMLTQQLQNLQIMSPSTPGTPAAQAPQVQQQELQTLLAQQADLTAHYTADHPDVIAINRKIAELRRKIAATPPPQPISASTAVSTAPRANEPIGILQLRAQIHSSEIGIQDKLREQQQLQRAIGEYQSRIEASPLVAEQYKDLTRDYDTAQRFYDDLLGKMNNTKMASDLEVRQQGEQFTVMDGANLPEAPTFPQRSLFIAGGIVVGLLFGLALAAFLEYKDTAMRTEQDIWAFTKLPTLAVIAYAGEIRNTAVKPSFIDRIKRLFSKKTPVETLVKAHG